MESVGAWAKAIARLSGAVRVLRLDDRNALLESGACTDLHTATLFAVSVHCASGFLSGRARLGQNKLKATPAPRLSTHAAQGPQRAKTLLALLSLGPRARAKKRSGVGGVAAALCSLQQLSFCKCMYSFRRQISGSSRCPCAARRMSDCTFCQSDERVMLFSLPLAGAHASIKMGRAPLIKCDAGTTRLLRDWLRIDFACVCNRRDALEVQVASPAKVLFARQP